MTIFKHMVIAATVVIGLTGQAAFADSHTGHIAKPLASLDFQRLRGGPIQIAVLWGDPQSGPSAVMLKFPPNFPGGMHHHTNSYHALLISGASKHWSKGESEADAPLQGPGDYWYQAGGKIHQDSFPTDLETIMFLQFDGPIDSFFVDEAN